MFYANNRQLFRTQDAGCTWQMILSLDTLPGPSSTAGQAAAPLDPNYSISSVAAESTSRSPNHETVYVVATDTDTNKLTLDELPTLFLVSTNGGATFDDPQPVPSANAPSAPEGTPACGNTALVVSPSDPRTAYFECEQVRLLQLVVLSALSLVTNPIQFFVTHDSGTSWTQISSPLTVTATPEPAPPSYNQTSLSPWTSSQPYFIVDPRHPATLWTASLAGGSAPTAGLWRSANAGASWTKVFAAPPNVMLAGVDAEYTAQGSERVVTWAQPPFGTPNPSVYLSVNGGRTWTTLPAIPTTAVPTVNGARQAWASPPIEDVTFAAGSNDLLAIMRVTGDYGQPGGSCHHAEAVRYNIKSGRWLPVPTPKEAVASPHGLTLSSPVSDHRGLAITTYYAVVDCGPYPPSPPVLMSYTDHTKS